MSYNFLVIFYGSQLKFYTKPRTFYSPGLHFFMIKEAVAIATAPFFVRLPIIILLKAVSFSRFFEKMPRNRCVPRRGISMFFLLVPVPFPFRTFRPRLRGAVVAHGIVELALKIVSGLNALLFPGHEHIEGMDVSRENIHLRFHVGLAQFPDVGLRLLIEGLSRAHEGIGGRKSPVFLLPCGRGIGGHRSVDVPEIPFPRIVVPTCIPDASVIVPEESVSSQSSMGYRGMRKAMLTSFRSELLPVKQTMK